ncbi:MAG TPA: nitrilase-related carbon-nitrogen hydrolase [Thermoleophilaceae bacterium]
MKVAVAQLDARAADLEGNVARTAEAIATAAGQGAELVVLPECVTTGWDLDGDAVGAVAEPEDGSGPALTAWRSAAREHGVAVIGGYAERAPGGLFNAVAVIGRDGELRGRYRKLHLFGREREIFQPGDLGLPIFELDGLRVGVLVCYDLRFPETMRLLALDGAQLVAVPTAWVTGFDARPVPEDDARIGQVDGAFVQANLNQVYVACADLSGETGDLHFLGRSVIVSPYGEPLAGPLPATGTGLLVAELSPQDAADAADRGNGIQPRWDRRTDVYTLERTPARPDGDTTLEEIERRRGYVLDLHRTLASRDPAFLARYEAFLGATFLDERTLTRREKELIYVGTLTALSTPEKHLVEHMRAAVANGATPQEVLETVELVLAPAGVSRFIEAMAAFESAFPLQEDHNGKEGA